MTMCEWLNTLESVSIDNILYIKENNNFRIPNYRGTPPNALTDWSVNEFLSHYKNKLIPQYLRYCVEAE